MDDTNKMVLSGIGVLAVVLAIAWVTLSSDPNSVNTANVTGPPQPAFLPPLWIVPIAGVVSVVVGVGIGTYQQHTEDDTE